MAEWIDDAVSRSLNDYVGRLLDRYTYNVERGNWDRAKRWAQAYDAVASAASKLVWEDDRADA